MIIPVNSANASYDIVLQRGALKKLSDYIKLKEGAKVLVVTDSGVPSEYAKTVASSFSSSHIFTFMQGEENKNYKTYLSICEELLKLSFNRKDAVIAVGGGVVGDMAGFAAATYMRGIDFYNIPTTLLSQVDSSIGGKTGFDFCNVKNIIGAFYQPKKVIIDPDVLSTLPKRQISNGAAESIKMGLTNDSRLFEIFEKENWFESIEEVIERSLKVKRFVVEQDEKEAGLRKVLNFGHTIGHAIEAAVGFGELYHGECVALGMIYMCSENIKERVVFALRNAGLTTEYDFDVNKAFEALCHDKKSDSDGITAVKCEEVGSFVFEKMTAEELINKIGGTKQ